MNIVRNRNIFYTVSALLFAGSIIALLSFGLKFGIDFTGGAIMEVEFAVKAGEGMAVPERAVLEEALAASGIDHSVIQPTGDTGVLLRFHDVDEATHQTILHELRMRYVPAEVVEKRFDSIGPTIGSELRRRSMYAVVLVMVLIILYIAWAFRRVSKPVSSWKYGVVAIIALVHDVVIPVGVFAILGKFAGVEVDALFVTAVLTILGFSVHDTIVVFDRIRENLKGVRSDLVFEDMVEKSLKETIGRSINTSLSVLLSLAAVYFFGGVSVKYFSLAMMLGVVIGTYSSIFIASPLVVTWQQFMEKGGQRERKEKGVFYKKNK